MGTFHKSTVDLIKMLDLIKSVHKYKESLTKSSLLKEKDSNDSTRTSKSRSSISDASKKIPKKDSHKAHHQKPSTNGSKKPSTSKALTKKPTSSKMKHLQSSSQKS